MGKGTSTEKATHAENDQEKKLVKKACIATVNAFADREHAKICQILPCLPLDQKLTERNHTALHKICSMQIANQNDRHFVKKIIELFKKEMNKGKRLNINMKDRFGFTPLMLSTASQNILAIDFLLDPSHPIPLKVDD